ncbi:hypothetical protein F5141DRAFT_1003841 [Pisolithus sp. B1]|nr:hypothetical protein F5141DRAFT_1003841 [Pisolithus sp. B1]
MNVIRNSRRVNPERSNNRRVNPTRPYHYYQDDERGRAQFRAETRGAMLRNPLQLQGRDVALRANRQPSDDSDEERENQRSLDSRLSNIWAQLFFDIIECVPNRRRARDGSWCTITKDDRRSVATEDLFKGFELPFEAVQWKRIRGDEWFALFKHFFPKKGQVPSVKRQNFTSCKYYIDYVALLDFLPNQSAKIVYEELYKKFRDLAWLPYAHSDRMWCTSQGSSGNWHHIPGDATGGPQIAINGDVWNNHPITLRNAYAHLREEEEEDA